MIRMIALTLLLVLPLAACGVKGNLEHPNHKETQTIKPVGASN